MTETTSTVDAHPPGAADLPRRRKDDLDATRVAAATEPLDSGAARVLQLFAHDVRGSMSAVKGIVGSVQRDDEELVTSKGRELLARADVHLEEVVRLLDAVAERAVAQAEATLRTRVDLAREVVERVDRMTFGRRTVHLGLDPGVVLLGTRDLPRIVEQLLSNAINHTGLYAEIWVSLRLEASELELVVADDGRGVPAELRERIFSPAERGTAPPSVAGLGLGLHLARRIAEEAGGTLVCEERGGGGALFRLRVPCRPADGGVLGTG